MKNPKEQTSAEWLNDYINQIGDDKVDMTQFASTASNDLKAADFEGKNLKVKISEVEARTYPARDGKPEETKGVLRFEGKEKGLVLNKTNTKNLINAYGNESNDWVGHEVGLSTHETELGIGWVVKPLDVEEPDFDDTVNF